MALTVLEKKKDDSQNQMKVRLQLGLNEKTFLIYEKQAEEQGIDVETLIGRRLMRCRRHRSAGLYLDPERKQKLASILGQNFRHPDRLVDLVRRLTALEINEVRVKLPPDVFERITHRSFDNESIETTLRRILEDHAYGGS